MGGKSKKKTTVTAEPAESSVNVGAYIAPMMGMLGQQNAAMMQMLQQNQNSQAAMYSQIPETTTLDIVDYDKENKTLMDKISKQIGDEDIKRKGVLGTILTSLDGTEPDTVKSLLSGEPGEK